MFAGCENHQQVVVLITDGKQEFFDESHNPGEVAARIKNEGIRMVTVGIALSVYGDKALISSLSTPGYAIETDSDRGIEGSFRTILESVCDQRQRPESGFSGP